MALGTSFTCHYAECCYAECHYAEHRYADCHFAECCYVECCYAECRHAESHGANLTLPYISWRSSEKAKKLRQNHKNFVFLLVFSIAEKLVSNAPKQKTFYLLQKLMSSDY